MRLRNSIIAKIVLLPLLAISTMCANYFIVRGAIASENSYLSATSLEMKKYFEKTGETKVFGSIASRASRTVKQEFQSTLIKWNYENKIHKSNTIYYISQATENYTPVRYNVGEIDIQTSVLIMPILDVQIDVKDYFNLTFLTDISKNFPHNRSSSAIIPKKLADHIITEKKLNRGNYKSLIDLTTTFEVTKGDTWAAPFLIAGVYDDSDDRGRFYQEAYGTCIIMPHTADIYYIENMKLNVEFVENSKKNIEILSHIEVLINASRNQFSWKIYQKDMASEFNIGSIDEVKMNSKKYFSSLENLDVSGTNLILSTMLIIVVFGCGFFLIKISKEKDFNILFLSSCTIGILIGIVFMAITKDQSLPLNEFVEVNRTIEICRASLFLTVIYAIFAILIPRIFENFKKYL